MNDSGSRDSNVKYGRRTGSTVKDEGIDFKLISVTRRKHTEN